MEIKDQNEAIARWMGWEKVVVNHHEYEIGKKTFIEEEVVWRHAASVSIRGGAHFPKYTDDLNEIAEAILNLKYYESSDHSPVQAFLFELGKFGGLNTMVNSTAPQRCEALLKSLKLWKPKRKNNVTTKIRVKPVRKRPVKGAASIRH